MNKRVYPNLAIGIGSGSGLEGGFERAEFLCDFYCTSK